MNSIYTSECNSTLFNHSHKAMVQRKQTSVHKFIKTAQTRLDYAIVSSASYVLVKDLFQSSKSSGIDWEQRRHKIVWKICCWMKIGQNYCFGTDGWQGYFLLFKSIFFRKTLKSNIILIYVTCSVDMRRVFSENGKRVCFLLHENLNK